MTKYYILFALLLAVGFTSCRSSRSSRSNASRNRQPAPQQQQQSAGPSAASVLSSADSALDRVKNLSDEDREVPPAVEESQQPNFSQQRTPMGSPYIPQPNLSEYGTYEAALGSYSGKRYDEAIALFSQIVTHGRPPELVPNAYYWMGESFYAEGRYAESLPYFEYVTRVGPEYKREMALYKLSRASLHLGNKEDANMYYERLRNEYPHSSHIATLRKLGAR